MPFLTYDLGSGVGGVGVNVFPNNPTGLLPPEDPPVELSSMKGVNRRNTGWIVLVVAGSRKNGGKKGRVTSEYEKKQTYLRYINDFSL